MSDALPRLRAARARIPCVVSVTGTNGKSTTTSMVAAVVAASGEVPARVTTLGSWVGGALVSEAPTMGAFVEAAERAVAAGVRTFALETTSKALKNGFARKFGPDVAVYTNLSRDHFDQHASPEEYLAAKAQLFLALRPGGVAVLNADDPTSALLEELVADGVTVRRYGATPGATDLRATRVEADATGTRVVFADSEAAAALGGGLSLRAVGRVHAHNAMGAALAALAAGYAPDAVRAGIEGFGGVPGRFEVVHRAPLVAVDYAHTPEALELTLGHARDLVPPGGRLTVVFGCGGDRDRGKRPLMGAIAHRLADVAVLTSDNPRSEDPEAIADAVAAGASGEGAAWHRELDRRAAIRWAVRQCHPEDVLVVAGKGHERFQERAGEKLPFDDAEVARAAAREAGGEA